MPIIPAGSSGTLPKIVYPSAPPVPGIPTLSPVNAGSLAARTEYYKTTYVTPSGEGVASPEASISLGANQVALVTSPPTVSAANLPLSYNVYGSTAAGSEQRQVQSVALGTNWQEPNTGLVTGQPSPPSAWGGTVLLFQRQPTKVPFGYVQPDVVHNRSYSGIKQSLVKRVDNLLTFDMEWVGTGADVAAWEAFLSWATAGAAFDYYPDQTQSGFTSYWWLEKDKELKYKVVGQYTFSLTFTQAIF